MQRRFIRGGLRLALVLCASVGTQAVASPAASSEGAEALVPAGVPLHAEVLQARATLPVDSVDLVHQVESTRGPALPPGSELFSFDGADNAPCVRAMPDLNNDGRGEILVGIDESGTDNIFVLDGASSDPATVLWSIETSGGLSGGSPYGDLSLDLASDVDGNGFPNILVGTAWGGRTAFGFDAEAGAEQWRYDTYLAQESGWIYSAVEMGDVDGDQIPDVAVGAGSDSDSVYLVSGSPNGATQATVWWRWAAPDAVLAVCNLGDANGDGLNDVLAAVGDNGQQLTLLDGAINPQVSRVLWNYAAGSTAFACGTLDDLNDDGVDEALVALWVGNGSAVRCLDGATGQLLWSSTEVDSFAMLVDTLPDLNGDGVPEVVASSFENAVTLLSGSDGSRLWKTPVGTLNGGDVWSARAIGDLDGDGYGDVVAGSFDYHTYALSGIDGDILWAFDTGNRVFSVYPVDDLNGDGKPEVAVGTQDTNSNTVLRVLDGGRNLPLFQDNFESGDSDRWGGP